MSFFDGMEELSRRLGAGFAGTSGIQHRLSRGEARERILQEALRPHVPRRFAMSSGEVLNQSGATSAQLDVLIVDDMAGTPFHTAGDIGVFPVEVVAGAISVRSHIRTSDLESVIDNVVSFKRLVPRLVRNLVTTDQDGVIKTVSSPHHTFGGVFAYTAPDSSIDGLPERFMDICLTYDPHERPDALVVLDSYCVTWGILLSQVPVITQSPEDADFCLTFRGQHSMLFFYLSLMDRLSRFTMPPVNLSAYLTQQGFQVDWKGFVPPGVTSLKQLNEFDNQTTIAQENST